MLAPKRRAYRSLPIPVLRSITNLHTFRAPVEARERDRKVDGVKKSDTYTEKARKMERAGSERGHRKPNRPRGPELHPGTEHTIGWREETEDGIGRMQTQKVTACALKMPGLCRGGDWTIGRRFQWRGDRWGHKVAAF